MCSTSQATANGASYDNSLDYFRIAETQAELLKPSPGMKLRFTGVLQALVKRGIEPDDRRIMYWAAAAICQSDEQRGQFLKGFDDSAPSPSRTPLDLTTTAPDIVGPWMKRRLLAAIILAIVAAASLVLVWWHFLRDAIKQELPIPPPPPDDGWRLVDYFLRVNEQIQLARPSWLLILAVIVLVCCLLWWLWSRAQKNLALNRVNPAPRQAMGPSLEADPFRDFFASSRKGLRRLLRHDFLEGKAVHARASIAATIRACGIPTMRFARKSQTSEYLLMTERESESDHMSVVARILRQKLLREQVPVRHFEFFRFPEILFRVDRTKQGQAEQLTDVLAAYPFSKVLLLLESDTLDSMRGAPDWLAVLQENTEVIHLNPRPPSLWSVTEARIGKRGLTSLFLGGDGLLRLGTPTVPRSITISPGITDLAKNLNFHRGKLLDNELPEGVSPKGLVADLADWLDSSSLQWLGILAVYPLILPRLTVELGQTVLDSFKQPLMNETRFIELARLPWLRSGWMPYWLRSELVKKVRPEILAQALPVIQAFILKPPENESDELGVEAGKSRKDRADLVEWLIASPDSHLSDRLLIDALKEKPPSKLGRAWLDRLPPSFAKAYQNSKVKEVALMCLLAGLGLGVALNPASTQRLNTGRTVEIQAKRLEKISSIPPASTESQALPNETSPSTTTKQALESGRAGLPKQSQPQATSPDKAAVNPAGPTIPVGAEPDATVYFEYDKSTLNNESLSVLDNLVAEIERQPKPIANVLVRCSTDNRTSREYGVMLSQLMCKSVISYLVKQGISARLIESVALGGSSAGTFRMAEIFVSAADGKPILRPDRNMPSGGPPSRQAPPQADDRPSLDPRGVNQNDPGVPREYDNINRRSDEAYDRGDFETALSLNSESCDLGSYVGCFWNGWLIEVGKGTTADKVAAAQWYNRACRLGHVQSCDARERLVPKLVISPKP